MHVTSLTLPLMALFASAYAATPTVTVYSDAACKQVNQVIQMSRTEGYQCYTFKHPKSPAVKFSTTGFDARAWAVWDDNYCDGDAVSSTKADLGQCLSAADYGLAGWYTADIGPR